jgi:hypothetical protein
MAGRQSDEREVSTSDLMAMLAQTMAQQTAVLGKLGDNTKPYEPGFGDKAYQDHLRATGHYDTFPIPVFQNGRECEPVGLPAQTRERAAGLRPGTYLKSAKFKDGVTVEATDKLVHLKYKSQDAKDRMSYPFESFEDLVDRIWDEMHAA